MTASLMVVTEVGVVQEETGETLAFFPFFTIRVIVGPETCEKALSQRLGCVALIGITREM
jgi:hypothetical protein